MCLTYFLMNFAVYSHAAPIALGLLADAKVTAEIFSAYVESSPLNLVAFLAATLSMPASAQVSN